MALTKESKLVSPQYVETFVRLLVNERKSMNSGATLDYSAATIIGTADVANYDLTTIDCQVWVHDAELGSPVRYMDVPAYTVVTVAINSAGDVKIINNFNNSINILIRITVRRKKFIG